MDRPIRLLDESGYVKGPRLSGAEFQRALRVIRARCSYRLRHLGKVVVTQHPEVAATGVGITLHERKDGWIKRHAVAGYSESALRDPAGFANEVTNRMLAWHSRWSAEGETDRTLEEFMW